MLFTSFEFIILVFFVFILYYLPIFRKQQITILILASFVFYAWNTPVLLFLLISSIAINIITSYFICFGKKTRKKIYAIFGVALNLLILGFFKYSPLLGKTFFPNSDSIGYFLINIPLPIGISFFTFQGISMVIDVFKNKKDEAQSELASHSLWDHSANVSLFISFFPQLVAGPIVKANEFIPQINSKRLQNIDWEFAFKKIVLGYFLKMVVADNLKNQTIWMAYPYFETKTVLSLLTMLFGYSVQIFADFAGYSLIAIGLAAIFGYRLQENFDYPYAARSFSEFWRRWHISLSSFLKEYLYIPLGGNRKGKVRTYVNLLITMLLGGLWHGAAWSYAVWGAFHGLLLATERFLTGIVRLSNHKFIIIVKMVMVFSLVTFSWLLFKLPDFSQVVGYIKAIFTNNFGSFRDQQIISIFVFSLPVIGYYLYYAYRRIKTFNAFENYEYVFYGTMLFLIMVNSGPASEFIYFQF